MWWAVGAATAGELESRIQLYDALLTDIHGDVSTAVSRYTELSRTLSDEDSDTVGVAVLARTRPVRPRARARGPAGPEGRHPQRHLPAVSGSARGHRHRERGNHHGSGELELPGRDPRPVSSVAGAGAGRHRGRAGAVGGPRARLADDGAAGRSGPAGPRLPGPVARSRDGALRGRVGRSGRLARRGGGGRSRADVLPRQPDRGEPGGRAADLGAAREPGAAGRGTAARIRPAWCCCRSWTGRRAGPRAPTRCGSTTSRSVSL